MSQTLSDSLAKITKGTGIVFVGYLVSMLLGFVGRPLIARCGTEADYGVYSLALVVLNICAVIAALGLTTGTPRSIAYARGKKDSEKVQKLIPASVQLTVIAGISLGIVVFFTSNIIAVKIFHDATLGFPLKIFALGIPISALINILVSVFQGFDDVKPTTYFQYILRSLLLPLLLLPVIFLKLPFTGVYYAFLASLLISCVFLIVYTVRRLPFPIESRVQITTNPVARELLLFSLPLFGAAMLALVIGSADTLMLGGLKSSVEVGLYNAARPLVDVISAPFPALGLIYVPVASGLYAQGSIPALRRNFSLLTKWLVSATLPLFLILFLFPGTVLGFLFGASYTSAATALRILSLGLIISNFFGPIGPTLIVMGQVRFLMWAYLATALLNIGLNFALIPPLGIAGAAITYVVAINFLNLTYGGRLYSLAKVQPLSKNLLKPVLASLALVFIFQFIFRNFVTVSWWMLPLLLILYYAIYGLAILLTKSFDQEDIAMLLAIEKRAGMNLSFVKRILRRFL
jgi:O-antigen/teichoic acid export membrane protein